MKDSLDYRAIGFRVRELRLQHNLTQENLAEMICVSPSFIGHIERGEKKSSLETMNHLAVSLSTTLDYLILGIKNRCNHESCRLYSDLKKTLDAYGETQCRGDGPFDPF